MALTIIETWTPSSEEWDNMWNNCPYSTYFHGREWAEIWADYTHGKIAPDPLGITISDGKKLSCRSVGKKYSRDLQSDTFLHQREHLVAGFQIDHLMCFSRHY